MTDRERFYLYLNGACPTGPQHELMGAFLAALEIGRGEGRRDGLEAAAKIVAPFHSPVCHPADCAACGHRLSLLKDIRAAIITPECFEKGEG